MSLLWALGDPSVRADVAAAHDTAVGALAGWIGAHAHTRFRIAGEVAVVDAEGLVAAGFRQHTSRALDPQLHTHLVVANRVRAPDGRWLALDARMVMRDQRTLSALYHVVLRSELTGRLGVRWENPDHGIAEITDVAEALRVEFSTRTGHVQERVAAKLDRFAETMGREPTVRERWRLEREAVTDSRPAKSRAVDAAGLHGQWADRSAALGLEPVRVPERAIGREVWVDGIVGYEVGRLTRAAMEAIAEGQSSWRPAELVRELAAAVPTNTVLEAGRLVRWLDDAADWLTAEACVELSRPVPPDVGLRRDGRPFTEAATDRALSTQAILDQETAVLAWADRRLRHDGADHPDLGADGLSLAQARAAAAVAGDDDLVLVVGPAGTGKTTALAPAVERLRADGRAVFGVAPSATAAEVLGAETGICADTLDKLLVEHRLRRPPDHRYNLPAGATVIVDEAGTIPTVRLAELAGLANEKGWRVTLVGDPLQFASVDRGGMFGLLVDTCGAVELDRVHRFTQPWEQDASLRLRRGDPTVAGVYEAHGRLHGGPGPHMEHAAVAAWWHHRRAGRSVLLLAPIRDAVARLNTAAQTRRVQAAQLDPERPSAPAGPYRVWAGDEIATRRNDRRLRTDRTEMVRNRATWTVDHVHCEGALTVTGTHGTVHLPAPYVDTHVELAYATTDAGAQGATVDAAVLFLDGPTDVRNTYVAMTRGRHSNDAYITTAAQRSAVDVFAQSIATDWIDQPAHTRRAELNDTTVHRPGLLDADQLRSLLERRHHLLTDFAAARSRVGRFPNEVDQARRTRTRAAAERDTLTDRRDAAAEVLARWDRPLRRRRNEPEITAAHRDLARLPAAVDDAGARSDTAGVEIVGPARFRGMGGGIGGGDHVMGPQARMPLVS